MWLDYLCLSWIAPGDVPVGAEASILREQVALGQIDMNAPQSPIDRLKVLINSSTPIVVMETVEEVRALTLVRNACSELSLAVFEWTIADGLVRSGSSVGPGLGPGQGGSETRLHTFTGSDAGAGAKTAVYNTTDPVQALANLETMT